jgi:hypothetical protein
VGVQRSVPAVSTAMPKFFAERFRGVEGHPYEQGFDLRLVAEKLGEQLRWHKPKMIFVNSMSDLFQDGVSDEYIQTVAEVMVKANWHTYLALAIHQVSVIESPTSGNDQWSRPSTYSRCKATIAVVG